MLGSRDVFRIRHTGGIASDWAAWALNVRIASYAYCHKEWSCGRIDYVLHFCTVREGSRLPRLPACCCYR